MRKVLSLFAMLFVSFLVWTQGVRAAEITDSKFENNKISLSGTGNTQVQIVLFGVDNVPAYMTTASVENGKFSITFPEIAGLKDGDYTVKVADYDGKNVDSKVITVVTEKEAEEDPKKNDDVEEEDDIAAGSSKNSIKTGDEKSVYICYMCAILAIVSGAVLILLNIQKNARKTQKQ